MNGKSLVFILLTIEFLDELVFGVREAAWPLIRNDLGLTYTQVGILLGVPTVIGNVIEPFLGILGDVWKRRALIVGGGLAFAVASFLSGSAASFPILLMSFILLSPASGAFVGLSQASLMDLGTKRHEQLMARWNLAGSLGVVIGPLLLSAMAVLGYGWRELLMAFAIFALVLTMLVSRQRLANSEYSTQPASGERIGFSAGLLNALRAMRRREVLRWLVLLEFADFMHDVLLGFLALYFVDVAGASPAMAGTAVALWSGVGLLGDALIIPLLERMPGLLYLRRSALLMMILYPALLLAPWLEAKLMLIAAVGLGNTGWYAILKGQLYSTLPGQSGTVMAISSGIGIVAGVIPAVLGIAAERFGLPVTMWLLLLGPAALLLGIPRSIINK